jgi:dolichol-phosphate mannosyltransferase
MTTDTKRTMGLVSVCAPVYNEEALVEQFYARATAALEGLDYELIIVNDGSRDATPAKLDALAEGDPRLRVIHLSRNFGHQAALTAGLMHARGDAVAMLDADLQDPPELITQMLDEWQRGADVVYMVRRERQGETAFKLATARWFYVIFRKLAQVELEPNSGDFRLLDRRALDALLSMGERNRFLRGMTVWVGFRQTALRGTPARPSTRSARCSASRSTPSPPSPTFRCRSPPTSASCSRASPSSRYRW